MKLNVNGNLISSNPDHHSVVKALNSLSTKKGGFAILSKDDNTYIQTSGTPGEGFELEYQDGSLDRHFRNSNRNLELSQVANTFTCYLESDDRWKLEYSWELFDLSPGIFKKPISRISLDAASNVLDRIKPPRLISIVGPMLLGAPFLLLGIAFASGFAEAFIEDPAGTIGGFIENGFVGLLIPASVTIILVIFPLILIRGALRNWRYRQSWNNGYSTASAIIKSSIKEKITGELSPTTYICWLTVQFHLSSLASSEESVTLKAQVASDLFATVDEGQSIPIRYARANPRIALLQGEFKT